MRNRVEMFPDSDRASLPTFDLRLPDGTIWPVSGEGPAEFTLVTRSIGGVAALASFDELKIAEAYMDGDLEIEGDMLSAIGIRTLLSDRRPLAYLWATYLQPKLFGQTRSDRKWIPGHYDEDPLFFTLWLDRKHRAYSHGFFEREDESLETGIERKIRYAFNACGIRPGQSVLDIGGGWGAFHEFAGRLGVKVTSLTISSESRKWIEGLIADLRLRECRVVQEHFLDYRSTSKFDAIVNLGVTEHLPDYRRTLAQYQRLLKPGKRVYLDAYSGIKHDMPSFIYKWIFQGNTSPLCLEEYLDEVARTPFEVVLVKNDRHNYFLTCKKWAENLEANRDEVVARWGAHLYRRFVLYLWAAANSFRTGTLSAHRAILQLPSPDGARLAASEAW